MYKKRSTFSMMDEEEKMTISDGMVWVKVDNSWMDTVKQVLVASSL